ncbi:MAG: PRC-barrel domain-containing protein [Elainella sp.]
MALMTIDEYSLYSQNQAQNQVQSQGGDHQIRGFAVHSDLIAGMLSSTTEEKLGTVADVLLDDTGRIQYVVVDLGTSPSGMQVLLPADQARMDHKAEIVYASGLTREQAEQLPAFHPEARR